MSESGCESRQRESANDFKMILAEDVTEKAGGWQEKKIWHPLIGYS